MRPTIDQVRALGQFASTYRWNMFFASYPQIGAYPPSEALNLRCISAKVPVLSGSATDVTIRGHKVKQPGIFTYDGSIDLTFVETIDNLVSTFLREWREACWQTGTGIQGSKAEVEAQVILHRLNNLDQAIWEYRLIGCFLEGYSPGGDLGEGDKILEPSIKLSYDYFVDRSLI